MVVSTEIITEIPRFICKINLQEPYFFFFVFFSIWLDDPHLTNERRTQDYIAS